jgi:hypothetical protein
MVIIPHMNTMDLFLVCQELLTEIGQVPCAPDTKISQEHGAPDLHAGSETPEWVYLETLLSDDIPLKYAGKG